MIENWLANAYEGMSRRQFLSRMSLAGFGLAGYALAANPVEGEIITTSAQGLETAEGKVPSGDFQIPIYEARPTAPGRYPVVLVLPEIFGMHAHIKDVTRRFAREGFLSITFEPYAREGGVLHLSGLVANVARDVDHHVDLLLRDAEAAQAFELAEAVLRMVGGDVGGERDHRDDRRMQRGISHGQAPYRTALKT
jgi:carboxymethylenebutenolidase